MRVPNLLNFKGQSSIRVEIQVLHKTNYPVPATYKIIFRYGKQLQERHRNPPGHHAGLAYHPIARVV